MIEQELTQYLVEKYDPIGIILFGSRATEDHPSNTDWDLFVFTDKTENDVEDFAEYHGWNNEFLEVTPLSFDEVDQQFILETATHPVRDMKILYDNSDGTIAQIIERTRNAYEAGPSALTDRKRDLYRKILTKYIRKAQARSEQPEVVFFATSQFFISAVRYWFELQQMWPQPIHEAMPIIEENDPSFVQDLVQLHSANEDTDAKIETMKNIRERLFPQDTQ